VRALLRIWIRVSGRVKDLGTRSTPAWERGFSSLLPLIVSAMALAAWAVAVIVSACAWVLENAGITCNGTCGMTVMVMTRLLRRRRMAWRMGGWNDACEAIDAASTAYKLNL
jgi:hypothetical protein